MVYRCTEGLAGSCFNKKHVLLLLNGWHLVVLSKKNLSIVLVLKDSTCCFSWYWRLDK